MKTARPRRASRRETPRQLGRYGEWRAALYYLLRGYRVVGRNVRIDRGEIDLIVRRGGVVVFVEVKTRSGVGRGSPEEAVDRDKQLQIARLASLWIEGNGTEGCLVRFDVIAVRRRAVGFELRCYRDAFELRADERRPWLPR